MFFRYGPIFAFPPSSLEHLHNLSKPFECNSLSRDLAERKLINSLFDRADYIGIARPHRKRAQLLNARTQSIKHRFPSQLVASLFLTQISVSKNERLP